MHFGDCSFQTNHIKFMSPDEVTHMDSTIDSSMPLVTFDVPTDFGLMEYLSTDHVRDWFFNHSNLMEEEIAKVPTAHKDSRTRKKVTKQSRSSVGVGQKQNK